MMEGQRTKELPKKWVKESGNELLIVQENPIIQVRVFFAYTKVQVCSRWTDAVARGAQRVKFNFKRRQLNEITKECQGEGKAKENVCVYVP